MSNSLFKAIFMLTLLLSIQNSCQKTNDEYIQNALDGLQGSIVGLSKMIAADDALQCYDYAVILYMHLKDFILFMVSDFGYSLENFGLALHKAPVAAYKCWDVWNDTLGYNSTIALFSNMNSDDSTSKINNNTIYYKVLTNVFYNFYDIYLILTKSYDAVNEENYELIGEYVGHLISDLMLKNPSDTDWQFGNSLAFDKNTVMS
jgi:hypothetical protein